MALRKLKHHEERLLKKVDFLNWKKDQNLRELQVIRRYHIQDREDYAKYVRRRLVGAGTTSPQLSAALYTAVHISRVHSYAMPPRPLAPGTTRSLATSPSWLTSCFSSTAKTPSVSP